MQDMLCRIIMAAKAVKRVFTRQSGQLNRGSFLGEIIYQLSGVENFENFVEIGTWNGQGSTKCFMDALLYRHDNARLYTLETNRTFHQMAKKYWRLILLTKQGKEKLRLIYGRILEIPEMLTCDEIPEQYRGELANYQQWLKEDIFNYDASPNVIDMLPDRIDVLLLDGGEFSTYAEFQKLRSRTGVILLDDTKLLKCKRVRDELLHDEAWRIIYDLPEERNGNLVACRLNYYEHLMSMPGAGTTEDENADNAKRQES